MSHIELEIALYLLLLEVQLQIPAVEFGILLIDCLGISFWKSLLDVSS
jgi:hypothetical protein